jgi:YtkA-like
MKNLFAVAKAVKAVKVAKVAKVVMICFVTAICVVRCDVSGYRNNPLRAEFEASLRAREPIELASVTQSGIRVQLFAPDTLQTGFTTMFVQLTDSASGTTLETGSVHIAPILGSTPNSRSTPLQAASTAAVKNFEQMRFPCDVVLLERGMYELRVRFTAGGKTDSVSIIALVRPSWKVVETLGTDGGTYFLTFAEPQSPRVGVQDFSVFVHRLNTSTGTGTDYTPVSGLALYQEPTMPSMGHGSEGNVSPTYRVGGRYDGKISFNMTGDWRIDMTVRQGNSMLLETFFFFII